MTCITPAQWLRGFLEKRELDVVSRDPLFTYQTTKEEYQSLKSVVSNFRPKITVSVSNHKDWSACFVLWCAEWYRREYQTGDGWSWHSIWQELNYELGASELSSIVPLGLESFWYRPIRTYTERRNFLGSVFIEGGLPFKLISSRENKFGDLIRKVLRNYYQVDLLGIKLNDLIARYLDYLPSVFSEDESIELISSIVRNLMSLAGKIDTDDENNQPSEQLDKIIPEWRTQFPIPLDDETGKGLLNNWLQGASSANSSIKKYQSKLSCKHYLELEDLSIYSEVSLPKTLNFSFGKSEVNSSKLDLSLLEGVNKRATFGSVFAQFEMSRTIVKPRKKGGRLPRNNVYTPLFIDISEAGVSKEKLQVEDSSIPLGEVPIGFVKEDGKYLYIGQSSFSTKHSKIYVSVPLEHKVDILNGYVEKDSVISNNSLELDWYLVSGDVRFNCTDCHYRIRTNASSNTSGMLEIDGDELQWETKPARIYQGVPRVKPIDGDTESTYGLTTLLDNRPVNTLSEYEKYGQHTFSVKNNQNDTLFRRKIAVLPSDFNVSFCSTDKSAEIIISTRHSINAQLEVEDSKIARTKNGNARVFTIQPNDIPPAKVKLIVQANLERDPVEIILPYPAHGIYGYDSEGQSLPRELTVNQLLGSELYLYSNKNRNEEFKVEIALRPLVTNSPYFTYSIFVGEKPQSINLYSFKERILELFSLSDDLRAEVQISVTSSSNLKRMYIVKRYSSGV